MQLRGCGTALVTPFHQDGSIDDAAFRNLVAWQVESGIDFLVPCGTTGETPTLTHDEWLATLTILGAGVQEACIYDRRGDTYYAELRLHHGSEIAKVDMRPSDALAVSLKAKVPFLVLEKLLAEVAEK